MKQRFKRSSGVVMPIFSLPSPYGIGTFGESAYEFVDFLSLAGQKYWQILPLGPTGFGDSPYQCYSCIAGNPYFIDLDLLVEKGLLTKDSLSDLDSSFSKINYDNLRKTRLSILRVAYDNANVNIIDEVKSFADLNRDWLYDYALFMAVRDYFGQKPVWEWDDPDIQQRKPKAIKHYSDLLEEDIDFHIFVQYLFFDQWNALKKYANKKGIMLIGDIPMYPSPDSCDVWVNPSLFKVDENIRPSGIAGVPPDYFSATGQLWGNPVYDWEAHKKENYRWWIQRIRHTLDMADVIRIDHFRAFQDYWEVPAGEETAINGKWCPGPRMDFFNAIKNALGDIPIIAEDLGIIDDSVRDLLAETGYPGMGVMIFGFREYEDNLHMPHNWKRNFVGYTSTHDSETICQSIQEILNPEDQRFALDYINAGSGETLGFSAIRTAFASSANLVMVMATDILSLGSGGRINVPGTVGNNWNWRANPCDFSRELAEKLKRLTKVYKRLTH